MEYEELTCKELDLIWDRWREDFYRCYICGRLHLRGFSHDEAIEEERRE
ncbi:MAG: hypothetical protein QW051_05105 [Candidatus Aenigmatarchaeota archaeon]